MHLGFSLGKLGLWIIQRGRNVIMDNWRSYYQELHHIYLKKNHENLSDLNQLIAKNYIDLTLDEKLKLITMYNRENSLSYNEPILDYLY